MGWGGGSWLVGIWGIGPCVLRLLSGSPADIFLLSHRVREWVQYLFVLPLSLLVLSLLFHGREKEILDIGGTGIGALECDFFWKKKTNSALYHSVILPICHSIIVIHVVTSKNIQSGLVILNSGISHLGYLEAQNGIFYLLCSSMINSMGCSPHLLLAIACTV